MVLLSRAASTEHRDVKEKAGTSSIESHFGARLIYFFLLLVRMQMAASRTFSNTRPLSTFLWHGPFGICSFPPRRGFPASLSFSLSSSLSHQYSSHLSRTDCPGSVMAQSSESSNEKPQNSGTERST